MSQIIIQQAEKTYIQLFYPTMYSLKQTSSQTSFFRFNKGIIQAICIPLHPTQICLAKLLASNSHKKNKNKYTIHHPRLLRGNPTRGRFSFGSHSTNKIWANYNDVSRGHPKWWFNKGTSPKSPKKIRFRNYTNLPKQNHSHEGSFEDLTIEDLL